MAHPNYYLVAKRAKHRCEYCRAPEVIFNVAFEVDHIIPLAKKGQDKLENLALSCRICNLRKLDKIGSDDLTTKQFSRLFNPRIDLWDEHFLFFSETYTIEGITPIGRVTVAILNMNTALQIRAREIWIK